MHADQFLSSPEVTVWTSPARAELAERLLDVMGAAVRPLGVGGPRCTQVNDLGKRWDVPTTNDLRKLRIDRPAAYLLLTSIQDVHLSELRAAVESGTRVLSLEPWAFERSELDTVQAPGQPDALCFAPAFSLCPGSLAAADPGDQLGQPRLARMVSHARRDQGSLLAGLVDAWLSLLAYLPMPETIDASLRHFGKPGQPTPGPRDLTGWLAAQGRLADGGSVQLQVSDRAARRGRELSILGPKAQLRIDDLRYELLDIDGKTIDAGGEDPEKTSATFVDLIARQWLRWLERPAPTVPTQRWAHALACVHACLLSARTGSPESPSRLLQIGRP